MAAVVYSPSKIAVTIGGFLITGKSEKFLKISMVSDQFKDRVGADSLVTRSQTNDLRATIEVTVEYGSSSNAALSALYAADVLSHNGAGISAFLAKDLLGGSAWAAEHVWVVKAPDVTLGAEPDEVTWVLRAAELVPVLAGL